MKNHLLLSAFLLCALECSSQPAVILSEKVNSCILGNVRGFKSAASLKPQINHQSFSAQAAVGIGKREGSEKEGFGYILRKHFEYTEASNDMGSSSLNTMSTYMSFEAGGGPLRFNLQVGTSAQFSPMKVRQADPDGYFTAGVVFHIGPVI